MKIASLLLVTFGLLSFTGFAQTYDEFILEANELYQSKSFQQSSKKWEEAFRIHEGFSSDYYNAACTNALAGNSDKAFEQLEKALVNGWEDIDWMQEDSDLENLKESSRWSAFIGKVPELREEYLRSLNIEMKNLLEDLRMQDQTIRLLLPDVEQRFGRESKEYSWFRGDLMSRNDSVVLMKVTEILNTEGWLGISEVGESANQTIWLVIQHAPLAVQQKYLPVLEESVLHGESKAQYLAFLEDRILMRNKEKQRYGTQSLWDKEKKVNVIWPVEDPETVNERRASVGLDTLEEYAANSGFLYEPDSQK